MIGVITTSFYSISLLLSSIYNWVHYKSYLYIFPIVCSFVSQIQFVCSQVTIPLFLLFSIGAAVRGADQMRVQYRSWEIKRQHKR
jgi:hypothetical protein